MRAVQDVAVARIWFSSECFIAGETPFEGSGLCFPRQSAESKVQGAGLCVCAARSLCAVGCEAVVLHVTIQ